MSGRSSMRGPHRFAQLPRDMLVSQACTTLSNATFRLLVAFAAEYNGRNNGAIALTWAIARGYGMRSKRCFVRDIAELLRRGLIVRTRQGGKRPLGPTLYALAWRPIDAADKTLDPGIESLPSFRWQRWSLTGPPGDFPNDAVSGPPGDLATNHRDPRGTTSGPPGDQTDAVSGPPGDPTRGNIGTPGGPPSIYEANQGPLRRGAQRGAMRVIRGARR